MNQSLCLQVMQVCCLSGLLLFCQCKQTSTDATESKEPVQATENTSGQDEATKRMAALIAKSFASIDPNVTPYFVNAARLDMFRAQVENPNPQVRLNAQSFYANELLNGGHTEEAITVLESLIPEIQKFPEATEPLMRMRRLLAVAYLRLGEEANCINQRNHESCIIPISPAAQFDMTQGSEAAMRVCLEILNTVRDEETIWLLNLAAMTIGRYPDGVPQQWRIPEKVFQSKDFPRYRDISHRVGIRGQSLAGGSCMEDFDGDGWLDIITSSWGNNDPLTFWKNDEKGGFQNASSSMGLEGINGGLNLIHGDVNNDGLIDIFVLRGAWLFGEGQIPNSLLLNTGKGKFRDVTEAAGVLTYAPTQTAVFADFNLDGWIDLFVGNESTPQARYPNEFYLNKGDGTFRNVTAAAGLQVQGMIKGVAAGDINNDGWPDMYLSDYIGPNLLMVNQGTDANGIPRFENVAQQGGVTQPVNSFPTWIFDYNNDGLEDIFVSGYGDGTLAVARDYVRNAFGNSLGGHPRIYRNNGNNTFTDVSAQMGMKDNTFTMGCNFGDIDTDGYLDFYLGTGNPEYSSTVPHRMFRNNGGKKFDDVTFSGGFGQIQKGHAVAFGDLDHDGDEDLFESLGGAFDGDVFEDVLYENPVGQDKSWVVLRLQGVQSNRAAIGARVKVTTSGPSGKKMFFRTVSTGGSFGSSSLQLEIGLNDAAAIEEIEVRWPVKTQPVQIFRNVEKNKYVQITEGNTDVSYPDVPTVPFR